jgi:hypothetical protein
VTGALLFVFGTKSYQLLENEPIGGVSGWVGLWSRWDSDQYLQLAKFGYTTNSEWKAWLYPFFPGACDSLPGSPAIMSFLH